VGGHLGEGEVVGDGGPGLCEELHVDEVTPPLLGQLHQLPHVVLGRDHVHPAHVCVPFSPSYNVFPPQDSDAGEHKQPLNKGHRSRTGPSAVHSRFDAARFTMQTHLLLAEMVIEQGGSMLFKGPVSGCKESW